MADVSLQEVTDGDVAVFYEHMHDADLRTTAAFVSKEPPDWATHAAHWARNYDLVRRLVEASEFCMVLGDFVLSSGKRSTVYFDKFLFLTRPDLLDELAREVTSLLPPSTDHLAAPEG